MINSHEKHATRMFFPVRSDKKMRELVYFLGLRKLTTEMMNELGTNFIQLKMKLDSNRVLNPNAARKNRFD